MVSPINPIPVAPTLDRGESLDDLRNELIAFIRSEKKLEVRFAGNKRAENYFHQQASDAIDHFIKLLKRQYPAFNGLDNSDIATLIKGPGTFQNFLNSLNRIIKKSNGTIANLSDDIANLKTNKQTLNTSNTNLGAALINVQNAAAKVADDNAAITSFNVNFPVWSKLLVTNAIADINGPGNLNTLGQLPVLAANTNLATFSPSITFLPDYIIFTAAISSFGAASLSLRTATDAVPPDAAIINANVVALKSNYDLLVSSFNAFKAAVDTPGGVPGVTSTTPQWVTLLNAMTTLTSDMAGTSAANTTLNGDVITFTKLSDTFTAGQVAQASLAPDQAALNSLITQFGTQEQITAQIATNTSQITTIQGQLDSKGPLLQAAKVKRNRAQRQLQDLTNTLNRWNDALETLSSGDFEILLGLRLIAA